MNIAQIRQQYPQYSEISDGELAFRLWDKDYKGKIAMGEFADKIQLAPDGFNQMVSVAETSGYQPTGEVGKSPTEFGRTRAAFQGATFGFGDEIVGAGAAGIAKAAGDERPFNQIREGVTGEERGRIAQFREEAPVQAIASEIAGAVASPANLIKAPAALANLGSKTRAAVTGGVAGAAYGAGTGEGGIQERAENAVAVGIPSALFGAAAQGAVNLGANVSSRVKRAVQRSVERPTLDTLRSAKNVAYQAVDDSGAMFAPEQTTQLAVTANRLADEMDFVPEVDNQVRAALTVINKNAGKDLTIGQIDRIRQGLWGRHNSASGNEKRIIEELVDEIDTLVDSAPDTSDLMQVARAANSRYKKSELLERAMDKAELQTSATGSGGNILNKYRQAVTSILTDPKKSKWFNDVEKAQMDEFVRGTFSENALRSIGKLSPNGSGLMLALNIAAVAAEPLMATASAAGVGAKYVADRSAQRAMQQIQNTVANGQRAAAPRYTPALPRAGASGISQLMQDE